MDVIRQNTVAGRVFFLEILLQATTTLKRVLFQQKIPKILIRRKAEACPMQLL